MHQTRGATTHIERVVTLRVVRIILRSYSVALLLASTFAVTSVAVAQVRTRSTERATLVQGLVMATDSCQLAPANWSGVCSSMVVPIEGELRLRKRGTRQRTVVQLNTDGIFTKQLAPGAYRIRLMEPHVDQQPLKRSAYRIYPRQVRIQGGGRGSARAASQANIFLVAHKSRGAPPVVAVSEGFTKG
jgi:hypothetical protein